MTAVETKQFIDSLVATVVQGIISFEDGFDVADVFDFGDEATTWKDAVEGLKENFASEASQITAEEVEAMFQEQSDKLIAAEVNPMLVGAIISNLKGIYYAYAAIVKSNNTEAEEPSEE